MKNKNIVSIFLVLVFIFPFFSFADGTDEADPALEPTAQNQMFTSSSPLPAYDVVNSSKELNATLFFRFHHQEYLACETQKITLTSNESLEKKVVEALLNGPSGSTTELVSLFPEETQVINTISQGNTLLITFSSGLLSNYLDQPTDWQGDDFWRVEISLRRKLAMTSLAATIMETFRYDTVQVLVEPTGSENSSMRLQNSYYQNPILVNGTAPALFYDSEYILTPLLTAQIILSAWESKDWEALYPFISMKDHWDLSFKPTFEQIRSELISAPALINFSLSPSSPSGDGQLCAFALDYTVQTHPELPSNQKNTVLRLIRENNIWKISFSDLKTLMGYSYHFQGDPAP